MIYFTLFHVNVITYPYPTSKVGSTNFTTKLHNIYQDIDDSFHYMHLSLICFVTVVLKPRHNQYSSIQRAASHIVDKEYLYWMDLDAHGI